MDWMQIVTVLSVFGGGFAFMISRIDKMMNRMDSRFAQVDLRFDALRKDMADLNAKVSNIEGQITQMTRPKVIRFKDEQELKEN